jgi:hypothetical protein
MKFIYLFFIFCKFINFVNSITVCLGDGCSSWDDAVKQIVCKLFLTYDIFDIKESFPAASLVDVVFKDGNFDLTSCVIRRNLSIKGENASISCNFANDNDSIFVFSQYVFSRSIDIRNFIFVDYSTTLNNCYFVTLNYSGTSASFIDTSILCSNEISGSLAYIIVGNISLTNVLLNFTILKDSLISVFISLDSVSITLDNFTMSGNEFSGIDTFLIKTTCNDFSESNIISVSLTVNNSQIINNEFINSGYIYLTSFFILFCLYLH